MGLHGSLAIQKLEFHPLEMDGLVRIVHQSDVLEERAIQGMPGVYFVDPECACRIKANLDWRGGESRIATEEEKREKPATSNSHG